MIARECLALVADTSLSGRPRELDRLAAERGEPEMVVSGCGFGGRGFSEFGFDDASGSMVGGPAAFPGERSACKSHDAHWNR
jgi:hypothetical protein